MDIYHSYCQYEFKSNRSKELKNLHELSVKCALHSYGNIHLITTLEGREFLGDLPYTSIEIFDEEIENINLTTKELIGNYRRFWALPKMVAYQQLAKKKKPFLHIDYDVFMFNRLPDEYQSADLVLQSIENSYIVNDSYGLEHFEKYAGQKFFYDSTKKCAYNCGIFGGNNFDIMLSYFREAMKLLLDSENQFYWGNYEKILYYEHYKKLEESGYQINSFDPLSPLIDLSPIHMGNNILEQFWLYQFCEHINFKPLLIFEDDDYKSWAEYFEKVKYKSNQLGFVHLMGNDLKYNKKIVSIIEKRVKQFDS